MKYEKNNKKGKKHRILKIFGLIFGILIFVVAVIAGYYTIREYRPEPLEDIQVSGGLEVLSEGDSITILSYNIGYAGLNKDADFFMDGGTGVQPENKEEVEENLKGISNILLEQDADVYFLQEVDRASKRTFDIDELAYYEEVLSLQGMYASNFRCDFVPYPLPPIGRVESGLATMTDYTVNSATRIALPESFKWPIKTCNLKRCMLETRIPIKDSDKELVLINFHLEAYDSGEGKIAQSKQLAEKLQEEYEKGNYVIAGGDFNQAFEGMDTYPLIRANSWVPGIIGTDDIPKNFSFAVSDNVPTCRLLNAPYSGNYEESQVYVLDGFIISDNLQLEHIENIDTGFEYTDHQPVKLTVRLSDNP